jgi:photosystem II stability/assembly factor-like uncharacterized protein
MSRLYKLSLVFGLFLVSFVYAQSTVNEHSIKFTGTAATLVGDDGIIMRSTNSGLNWIEQNSNVTNALLGNSSKSGLSIVAGENGVILRSVDNGMTWDMILPGTLENLNDAEVIDVNNAVVCGNNGTILASSNSGLTWDSVVSGVNYNLLDIKFINNTGFITGEMGTLLKSVDAGRTWTEIDMSFTNNKFNAVEVIDADNLILVGEYGKILLSNNGGESWYGPSGFMYETNLNDVVFFSSTDGIIAGDDGLILKTVDGGYSWTPSVTPFVGNQYDFFSVAFEDINYGISIGNEGVDVYTSDGGNTWNMTPPIKDLAGFDGSRSIQLKQNYPNPFNPSTVISFQLPKNANVTLKIYDIIGKEVACLVNGHLLAGSHSVNFNASGLASGVYFYKINISDGVENNSRIMKMILTK